MRHSGIIGRGINIILTNERDIFPVISLHLFRERLYVYTIDNNINITNNCYSKQLNIKMSYIPQQQSYFLKKKVPRMRCDKGAR
jgi:hypothetical protein